MSNAINQTGQLTESGGHSESANGFAAELGQRNDTARAPAAVRYAVITVIGLVVAGALYLLAVRGDALLADLSAIAALICG